MKSLYGHDTYPILYGLKGRKILHAEFRNHNSISTRFILLVDKKTKIYCLPILLNIFPELKNCSVIDVEIDESRKSINTCILIWNKLTDLQANRQSILINLGGGILSDIGGFVASTFKRGIQFITIPTTLLAQVDASIGGKTGINFNTYKNQIGSFANPRIIYIDSIFLKSLSRAQIIDGFAEMLKHALIANKKHWLDLKKFDISTNAIVTEQNERKWLKLIKESNKIKSAVFMNDPLEKGLRKSLNFGHTIAHAIESIQLHTKNRNLSHGEAVAAGMICESYLSFSHRFLDRKSLEEICNFITIHYRPIRIKQLQIDNLIKAMLQDKKNSGPEINFTLLNGIGNCMINQFCNIEEIKESLTFYRKIYEN